MNSGYNQSPVQLSEPRRRRWRGLRQSTNESSVVTSCRAARAETANLVTCPECKRTGQTVRAIVTVVVAETQVPHYSTMLLAEPSRRSPRSRKRRALRGCACRSAHSRIARFRPLTTMKLSGGEISRDPIGEEGGANLYGLTENVG